MSEGQRGKKRSKSYYKKCAAGGKRQKRGGELAAGMKGFLIMCNTHEKETVRETYNILNEYADELYGPELKPAAEDESTSESDDDMEAAMARETAAIKEVVKAGRRFQQVDTKTKNIIFVRTTVNSPCLLAHRLFTDLVETKVQKSRYAIRLIPITVTCKANLKSIEEAAKVLFKPHFETGFGVAVKYTSVCKIRNNQNVSRTSLLPSLGRIIREMNPLHQLCHDEPDVVVLIEVIRNVCCLSAVKDFFTFKKYNMHEVVKPSGKASVDSHPDADEAIVKESDKSCRVLPQETTGNAKEAENHSPVPTECKSPIVCLDKEDHNSEVKIDNQINPPSTESQEDLTLANRDSAGETQDISKSGDTGAVTDEGAQGDIESIAQAQ